MRRLALPGALAVLAGVVLAWWLRAPELADDALFGAALEHAEALQPLVLPGGNLQLAGRVVTVAGAPAADAFVVLERPEDVPSRAEPLLHAYTDGDGRFALAGLAPGKYRVVLVHASAPPRELELELPAEGLGKEVRWELAAPLPPLPVLPDIRRRALAGRVLAPAVWGGDEPHVLEGFEVVLGPAPGTPPLSGAAARRATTDAEGRFELAELVVADYQVELLPPWARGGSWPVLARSVLAGDAPGEILLAPRVGALEGELHEAGGEPLVGALVEVTALDERDPVGKPERWPPEVTDEVGRFRIELLPPGRYRVHVRAGTAVRDVDVAVEADRRTSVPLEPMSLRGTGAGG